MAAQQRGSCKNEFGVKKQRDDQLFYLPPSFPFFSSLVPFLIRSAGGLFWGLLLLPYFPLWRRSKCTSMAWLLDFSLWQAQEKPHCSLLSRRMHHRGSFESEWGKKLDQHPAGNITQGQKPLGWRGFHKGWDISKRGKGRCRWEESQRELRAAWRAARTEQPMPSFSCGRFPPTQTSLTCQWKAGWSNLQWECNSLEAGRKKDASSIWWK